MFEAFFASRATSFSRFVMESFGAALRWTIDGNAARKLRKTFGSVFILKPFRKLGLFY